MSVGARERITLGTQTIEYELRASKTGRTLRLTVHPIRGLIVTIPKRVTKADAEKFIREKSEWVLKVLKRNKNIKVLVPKKHTAKEIKAYKEQARALATARLAYFNTFYNFPYKAISIRNQKTRWGSCSREHNVSFNYKIALLSPKLSDYVVVHELCHVKEMNHSGKFWGLVAETIPDYPACRKELRSLLLSM